MQENLVTKEEEEEEDFILGGLQENKINASFYFFWWAYTRLPLFLVDLVWNRREKNNKDCSLQQIANQIEEQKNQVSYLLSVKY